MTTNLKTASSHNEPLTGEVEMETLQPEASKTESIEQLKKWMAQGKTFLSNEEAKSLHRHIASLESSLSRAQERLKEIEDIAQAALRWKEFSLAKTMSAFTAIFGLAALHRLATEDAKPSPEREEKPTVKPEKE